MKKESYVYVYLRKDLFSPYYVGKGKNGRDTNRKGHRNLGVPAERDRIRRVKENLTDAEACELEDVLIAFYGLMSEGGVLRNKNKTHNQAPNNTGRKASQQTKDRISAACQGRVPWNKGKKVGSYSLERRKAISEACKGSRNPARKKVLYEGVVYDSYVECGEAHGRTHGWVCYKVQTGKAEVV